MTERHDERSGQLPIDPVLREFVRLSNATTERMDEGQPLTLYVNGAVVSGWLIPNWQWFQEQADILQGDGVDFLKKLAEKSLADARQVRAIFDKLGDLTDDEQAILDERLPQFIYLKAAHPFLALPVSSREGIYWRGRLSSVDAWAIGILRVSLTGDSALAAAASDS